MAQMLGVLHYVEGGFLMFINIIIIRGFSGSDARLPPLYKAAIFFISYYNYNKRTQ